jgi:FAD:protein FMN transferase
MNNPVEVVRIEDYYKATFQAMASPCTVLIDTDDVAEAKSLTQIAEQEAHRIEYKFSRYLDNNIVHRMNHANGQPIETDEETAHLINYAAMCYEMSDGMFDITSGVLRKAWTFDGGSHVPAQQTLNKILRNVGWQHVIWNDRKLTMRPGMEIDLGGIGKEYAVDRAAALIARQSRSSFVVNFGGDLYASGARRANQTWGVGIDDPDHTGTGALYRLDITRGALATSGDARRYVMWNGKRLGHILNPKTGWPIEGAPRSITVLAQSCMEAGTLSTLAYLQGSNARKFLEEQKVQFWIL